MAIKNILKYGDPILRMPSKEVLKVSKKIQILIEDLVDTMYAKNGVGLAAPQIGHNVRVFVIDVSEPKQPSDLKVFINPKIIKKSEAIISNEGCLSFPQAYFDVKRYKNVTIKAQNEKGRTFVLNAEGGTLLSRAIQHEYDHLDGVLFVDHCKNRFEADEILKKFNLPGVEVDKLLDEPELGDHFKG